MKKIVLMLALMLASVASACAQDTVSFDNQSGEPALVKLVGPSSSEIEVPNGTKKGVQASAGRYFIKVRYGIPGNYHYAKGEQFEVKETPTSRSETTITLHKVVAGNYESEPISEKEFGPTAEHRPSESRKPEKEGRRENSILEEKPSELLPGTTALESSGTKVVFKAVKGSPILSVVEPGEGYKMRVYISFDEDGQLTMPHSSAWSKDAVHEFREEVSFAGYTFRPSTNAVLLFTVVPDAGYKFLDGSGIVVTPDGKEVTLSKASRGLVIGHPVKKK